MNDLVKAFMNMTNGRKTYTGAILYVVLTFAVNMGWLTAEVVAPWLEAAMGMAAIGAVHKVDKATAKKGK